MVPVRVHHEHGVRRLSGDSLSLRRWEEPVAGAVDHQQRLGDSIEYAFEVERVGFCPRLGFIF